MDPQSAHCLSTCAGMAGVQPSKGKSVPSVGRAAKTRASWSRRSHVSRWPVLVATAIVVANCAHEQARRDARPQLAGFRLGQTWQESARDVPCRAGNATWLGFDTSGVDLQLLRHLDTIGSVRWCGPADSVEVLYVHDTLMQVRIDLRRLRTTLFNRWARLSSGLIPAFGLPDSVTWGGSDRFMTFAVRARWNPSALRPWLLIVSVDGNNGSGESGWSDGKMQLDACAIMPRCPPPLRPS